MRRCSCAPAAALAATALSGRGAALGHDDGVDSGAVGGAEQRAEILRVFDAVESEDEARGAGGLENIFDGEKFLSADDGDDALVGGGVGDVGKGFAGLGANADLEVAAEGDDGFEAVVAAFTGYEDVIETALACFEGFFYRMDAVEGLHLSSVWLSLGVRRGFRCRRSGLKWAKNWQT